MIHLALVNDRIDQVSMQIAVQFGMQLINRRIFSRLIAVIALFTTLSAWAQPCYRVTPILPPSPKQGIVISEALNDRGEVTGELRKERDNIFVWSEQGGMHVLPSLPSKNSYFGCYVHAINNTGQVTGNCGVAVKGDVQHGLSRLEQDTRGPSEGASINNDGKIVGYRSALNGGYEAFLYDPCCGMRLLIPHDPGSSVFASFINTSGLVIGFDSTHLIPFAWSPDSEVRYLYAAANTDERAYATALNDDGIVLLDVWRKIVTTLDDPRREIEVRLMTPSDSVDIDVEQPPYRIERHAYLYDLASGKRNPIGHLPGGNEDTRGLQINREGEVVGMSGASNIATRAFYWHPRTGMLQLDQLIDRRDPYNGIALSSALRINDLGQILAISTGTKGAKPFLLTPVVNGNTCRP